MKPYRESHANEALIEAPIERVWALHTNPDEMRAAFSHFLALEIVAGQPGTVGCVVRATMRTPTGKVGTADSEIVAVDPPRSMTTWTTVVGASNMRGMESTRLLAGEGKRTRMTFVTTAETVPISWVARAVLRMTKGRRVRESAFTFGAETAEENAYFARTAR